MSKIDFLKNKWIPLLKSISPTEKPIWGLMNFQQMIEHMSDALREANGKTPKSIHTPAAQLDQYKAFMMSEKPFKENTKNAQMPATPFPVKQLSVDAVLTELQQELNDFLKVFEKEPEKVITNLFFGHLNFEEWVHLLHKHATHHLKQFGVNL